MAVPWAVAAGGEMGPAAGGGEEGIFTVILLVCPSGA